MINIAFSGYFNAVILHDQNTEYNINIIKAKFLLLKAKIKGKK